MKVHIVSATRQSLAGFQTETALGKSIERLAGDDLLEVRLAPSNARGLPTVFNEILEQVPDDGVVVFVHDDVWLDDYYLIPHVLAGLRHFDIVGLAGNHRRIARQPSWSHVNLQWDWDDFKHLSGRVAHGPTPGGKVAYFGEAPAPCELLDGVFLAAYKRSLTKSQVRFDPRFDFHCYDLDFCRTARQQGLRLGTWPICVTHQSTGSFGSPEWRRNYDAYLAKWGE